jgi:phosphate transport system substrate-binding protein
MPRSRKLASLPIVVQQDEQEEDTPMTSMRRAAALAVASVALGAAIAGPVAAQDVEGTVSVHGSSTVAPISLAVAESLAETNPGFGYLVGDEGTGDGFSQYFCVDNADIADASRAIKDSEAELCAEYGVEWAELKVAYDGLAVITSPLNPITCLALPDLYALFGPESDAITTWEDAGAFAAQLGSTTSLPAGPIAITAPSTESGTYDSFIELALGDLIEERGQQERLRNPVPPHYVGSANDRVIIEGVAGTPDFTTTIGYVGLAYAIEAGEAVKIVAVDGGEGCVMPDETTVSDGSYVISRPLYIYAAVNRLEANPAIAGYVDYYLSDDGIAKAADVGYVPLPAEELEATRAAWAEATGR